jgi:hypothetical protein
MTERDPRNHGLIISQQSIGHTRKPTKIYNGLPLVTAAAEVAALRMDSGY